MRRCSDQMATTMSRKRSFMGHLCCGLMLVALASAAEELMTDDNPLLLPAPGAHQLRVLSSNLLELTLITTKAPDPAKAKQWDFVDADQQEHLPDAVEFVVLAGDQKLPVETIGFKRRVLYAPLANRDLRIGNYLYLQLARAIGEGENVEVKNPSAKLWSTNLHFTATSSPLRFSPAIHVNQAGY